MKAQHGLVVSPDGADVYVVGKPSGSGQVVELRRDQSTGAISEIGCVAAGAADGCSAGSGLVGAGGIAVSPDGASVYVASAVSNAVVAFHRDAGTGVLSETGCIADTVSGGCTTAAPGLKGATGITVSPDGASVYATSESSNAVVVFTRNTSTGTLTWHGCVAESAAEGCATAPGLTHAENVVVSPDGANVYVTAFSGNSVVEFSRSSATGDLTSLTSPSCIAESGADGCGAGHGLNGADGIAISPSGASVYIAAENSNAVVTFARAGAGGLTEQACTAETAADTCTLTRGLNGADRVAVTPDGQSVYATGYNGYTLVGFSRSAAGAIAAQSPCLGQSGNTDGCTAVPGLSKPAALGVSPDGHNIYTGTATSNATDSFTRQQPTPTPTGPTAAPTITGIAAPGRVLTEGHSTWTNDPISFKYQWEDCNTSGNRCAAIAGARAQTYKLTSRDGGHTIRVKETAVNAAGSSRPTTSAATAVVVSAPSRVSSPVITGVTEVGRSLSASNGTWSGSAPISYRFQWRRCAHRCSTIAGATRPSYKLVRADAGDRIQVLVSASNVVAPAAAVSPEVGPVVTAAQVRAWLKAALVPHGKAAKINQLRKHGGFASFAAMLPGGLSISWYAVAGGGHRAAAHPVLVATGRVTLIRFGSGKLALKLTVKGRRLLRHVALLRLSAKGAFTAPGQRAVRVSTTFTVTR